MYHPIPNHYPLAEEYQTATYNGFPFLPAFGHRRTAPVEEPFIVHRHNPSERGWYQGNRKLHNFKSKKYFVRPIDGGASRRGNMGRLKDVFSGQGADVFVVANGDRRTFHRDRPKRSVWSNWDQTGLAWTADANWRESVEDRDWYPSTTFVAPWARRKSGEVYNFRTREFERLAGRKRERFWSDAHYGPRGERPRCYRTWDGQWHSDVAPSAGLHAGGRPLWNPHNVGQAPMMF